MEFEKIFECGPKLISGGKAYPISTDAVLLANFANVSGCTRILDIGTGSGIIALLLAYNNEKLRADGIEIDPLAAEEARLNAEASGLGDRVRVITGDFRLMKELDLGGRYDAAVSNPPYFTTGSGKVSDDAGRSTARSEVTCTLRDLAEGAKRLVKYGGKFFFVYKPERLGEVMSVMRESGLEPKRLRMVHGRADLPAAVVLIECRLGGKTGLKIEPPLILKDGEGSDSPEIKKIYKMKGEE